MDSRIERVVLETARHRIVGDLVLPSEGYRSRLSDFLNRGGLDFIPLTEVELTPLEATGAPPPQSHDFLTVARAQIELAYPLPNPAPGRGPGGAARAPATVEAAEGAPAPVPGL